MTGVTATSEKEKVGIDTEEEQDLSFEDLYSEGTSEGKAKEPEEKDKASDSKEEPKDKEKQEDKPQKEKQSKGGKGFHFNADKYKEKGITDEKALAELEKQERRLWEKDRTIGRQGQNLGDLRKQLEDVSSRRKELKNKTELSDEEYNDLHIEDPAKARRKADEAIKARQEDEKLEVQERELRNKSFLSEKLPDYEDLLGDIEKVIRSDLPEDLADSTISEFKKAPYQLEGLLAFNLGMRAKLVKENSELKAQLTSVKDELKNQPKNVIDKINKMTVNPHSVGTQSGKSSMNAVNSSYDLLVATPDQLNDMLVDTKRNN